MHFFFITLTVHTNCHKNYNRDASICMVSWGVGIRVDSTFDLRCCQNKVQKAPDFPEKSPKRKFLMFPSYLLSRHSAVPCVVVQALTIHVKPHHL